MRKQQRVLSQTHTKCRLLWKADNCFASKHLLWPPHESTRLHQTLASTRIHSTTSNLVEKWYFSINLVKKTNSFVRHNFFDREECLFDVTFTSWRNATGQERCPTGSRSISASSSVGFARPTRPKRRKRMQNEVAGRSGSASSRSCPQQRPRARAAAAARSRDGLN